MQHPLRARMCGFGDKVSCLALAPMRCLPRLYLTSRMHPLGSTAISPSCRCQDGCQRRGSQCHRRRVSLVGFQVSLQSWPQLFFPSLHFQRCRLFFFPSHRRLMVRRRKKGNEPRSPPFLDRSLCPRQFRQAAAPRYEQLGWPTNPPRQSNTRHTVHPDPPIP